MAPGEGGPAEHYVRAGGQETGAANLVSAILFDYRGFDTLGEAAVVFAAVAGTALVLGGGGARYGFFGMSIIARLGIALVLPFLLVYGLHLMVFGHLTPGGGFQGGTVLATASILVSLLYGAGYERLHVPPRAKEAGEALGGLLFISIGSVGVLLGLPFLTNLGAGFPRGTLGRLVSGGFIPLLNLAVGLKVGAGLSALFATLGQDLDLGQLPGGDRAIRAGDSPLHDDRHLAPAAPTVQPTPAAPPTPMEPQS